MDGVFGLETPCYIYDERELINNLSAFKMAAENAWKRGPIKMGISVKTAPLIAVLEIARRAGYFAEVVSDEEYALALEAGFDAGEVIFNGPIKSEAWMHFALANGAVVNIDSRREIGYAIDYLRKNDAVPKVGLRANFDLEAMCPGETLAGSEPARFGFCVEDGSLADAVRRLRDAGIEPVGLHAHFSTNTHSVSAYFAICREVAKLVASLQLDALEYVDIGGGFYGGGQNRTVYAEYAQAIADGLADIPCGSELDLVLEPGGSVLATAGALAGRVIDVKTVRGSTFVVTELSKLWLNSTVFGRRNFSCDLYRTKERKSVECQTICGFTCMEMDRIADIKETGALAEGDIVVVQNAGAYTASFAPAFFIKENPGVYVIKTNGEFRAFAAPSAPVPPKGRSAS